MNAQLKPGDKRTTARPVFFKIRMQGVLLALAVLLSSCAGLMPESARTLPPHKPLAEVVLDDFTRDTQVLLSGDHALVQAWWIPVEFWQAALSQASPALAEQAVTRLQPYSMVAVVQADVSTLGGFAFYSRDDLQQRLQVQWQRGGQMQTLSLPSSVSPAVQQLLMQLTPLLSRMMGDVGRNLHFFVLDNQDARGQRWVSPYEDGAVTIRLAATATQPAHTLTVELPVNALFEPRRCANGKPAHLSWRFCPWDGAPLP